LVNFIRIKSFTNIALLFQEPLFDKEKMDKLANIASQLTEKRTLPEFKAGDTVTVHFKIKEGDKERIQQYQGVVVQRKGTGVTKTFTVRKMSNGVGVERIFPDNSPFIDKIDVNKRGVVRRAKIYYIRELKGKKARIREKVI
jgi:large subunit ribosomal protein L19